MEGTGEGGGVGEEEDKLHLCIPSSADNSLLNIICKVLYKYVLFKPFHYQDLKANSPKWLIFMSLLAFHESLVS